MTRFYCALILVVLCIAHYGEAQQCSTATTVEDFRALLRTVPSCFDDDVSVIRKTANIIIALFDADDQLTGQLNRAEIDAFCMSLTTCIRDFSTQFTACDTEIKSMFGNMGDSLCTSNGTSQLSELNAAADHLKASSSCDVNDVGNALLPEGCHLQELDVNYPSYYSKVIRERRKNAAMNRCLFRYVDSHAVDCSHADVSQYAKLIAAGEESQYLTQDYNQYTNFQKQFSENSERTVLAYYGSGQAESGGNVMTCGLTSPETALWTTFYRVVTDYTTLEPEQMSSIIKSVNLLFSDTDGTAIGAYDAYVDIANQNGLPTTLSSNTDPSLLSISSTGDSVRISHKPAATDFYVYKAGSTIGITIVTPTKLVEMEGLGILVDGCQLYNGRLIDTEAMQDKIDDLDENEKEQCDDKCRGVANGNMRSCLYTCSHGVNVQSFYQKDEVVELFTSSANFFQSSMVISLLPLIFSFNYL